MTSATTKYEFSGAASTVEDSVSHTDVNNGSLATSQGAFTATCNGNVLVDDNARLSGETHIIGNLELGESTGANPISPGLRAAL